MGATPFFVDVSPRARLRATGKDLLNLLHRLSTQDLKELPVGTGRPTVLTSPKGRIVERLFVHRRGERDVILAGGEGRADTILTHLRKYTFGEETGLSDWTSETVCYSVPGSAGSGALPDPGPWGVVTAELRGSRVTVLGQDGFSAAGRSVIAGAADRELLREHLSSHAVEKDAAALERWRIEQGFPGPAELSEEWNPLEAGLRDHVSFTKGCYVGQEVVARLNTYDRVSRRLAVLRFEAVGDVPEPGSEVWSGERVVGRLTSVLRVESGGAVGLAFLKTRELPLASVRVGGFDAWIVSP